MATATARETGITCDECESEFVLGTEYLYFYGRKLHQGCAAQDAAARRGTDQDAAAAAREILASGSRVVLSRSQLRSLVGSAVALGLEPVRKPDSGRRQWYGRMPGWSAERVRNGLAASEAAGMWLDFLDAGRMPPLRTADLAALMDVIGGQWSQAGNEDAPASVVTSPLPGAAVFPLPGRRRYRNPREGLMTNRDYLRHRIRHAADGQSLARAVADLDAFDRRTAALAQQDRETDLGARIAEQRLAPFAAHEHHTAATDWLGSYDESPGDYRTAMIAEASVWYRNLEPAVRADREELGAQASGRARTLASAYPQRGAAEREFLSVVGYLHAQAASGLPQIDQTVDPNNQPQQTPYPTQVFPTFAPDQDQFNQNIEGMNHDSQVSSEQAPLIQTVMQQDAGGSGYGSGPERPDAHTTSMDTADSYAEVPLGPPGQISTVPVATDSMGSSHPNPVAGTQQDAGADRRQAMASVIDGYSLPDPFGYRWAMQSEVMHPFHERCGSGHWPDESCGGLAVTASVAVGYAMNLDDARSAARCEAVGVREGLRAVTASHSAAELGDAHNRFTSAWGQSERTMDDTAVLHGFMAVVRPVLAELSCTACKGGDCSNCHDQNCACAKHPRGAGSRMAASGLAAGGVTESEREGAPHHLPGPGDKFPVGSAADVENAKHDVGRTSEPHGKVKRYINEMAKEYHVAPLGKD